MLRCDMLYDMNVTMMITFVKAVIIVTKVMTIYMIDNNTNNHSNDDVR